MVFYVLYYMSLSVVSMFFQTSMNHLSEGRKILCILIRTTHLECVQMTGLTHNNFKISGQSERAKKTVSDFEISFLLSICLSGGER